MGVMAKLIDIMDKHPDMSRSQMVEWITQRWEPAHNIELATKDIKDLDNVFDWFNNHIRVVNDATEVLRSGKGLQQTVEAAEELSIKFYKLRALSSTRFSAYFESSLSNFEKSIESIIKALQVRSESKEKKVKDIAVDLLKHVVNKQFLATHLGLIDVYRMLGTYSSKLQEVEQFPWEVTEKLESVVKNLRSMSQLDITSTEEVKDAIEGIDVNEWPKLKESLEKILQGKYISSLTPLLHDQRRGRSLGDIGDTTIIKTVDNRLKRITKHLADRIEARALKNDDCPVPDVIKLSGECFDLRSIVKYNSLKENIDENNQKLKSLRGTLLRNYPSFSRWLVKMVPRRRRSLQSTRCSQIDLLS